MTDIRLALSEHLRGHASPVLFVGSGLSRRYAGADNWEGLLRHFAAMTTRPYDYYRSKANGDFPTIASQIAQPFGEIWWDDDRFRESRDLYSATLVGPESPLKIEVARHLTGLADRLPTTGALATEVTLLRNVVVDAVITTNYDDVLPCCSRISGHSSGKMGCCSLTRRVSPSCTRFTDRPPRLTV
jgi:hypothetical protein